MQSDFSHAKLRGRSFKGQDLRNTNFSHADIRGATFAHAQLQGANFTQVQAGLQRRWVAALVILIFFLAFLAGCLLGTAGSVLSSIGMVTSTLERNPTALELILTTAIPVLVMIIFGVVLVRRGLGRALGMSGFSAIAGVLFILVITFAVVGGDSSTGTTTDELIVTLVFLRIMMVLGAMSGTILGAIALSTALSFSRVYFWLIGVVVFLGTALMTPISLKASMDNIALLEWGWLGVVNLSLGLLSLYLGWRAFQGDKKYALVRVAMVALSNYGGTSFRAANLTDTNFSQAILRSTDFRQAILTHTNWYQAQYLSQSRIDGTYLVDDSIRDLVITKNGHEHIFDRQDLRELNLQHANLSDASFIGADLSRANLQQADLSRAKLVQAQLYRTNLTEATLTGAYIQDWAISIDTELRQVRCDYIYMRLPTKDDPDPGRKPDNRQKTFTAGEFTDFISPILKTLDLYQQQDVDMLNVAATHKSLDLFHQGGLDPSAAAIALKQLAEQFPEAGLEVVALEGRGHERVRVQARVNGDVDRCELSEAYFAQYEQVESMPYGDIQALIRGIEEKDARIRSLESMVMNALEQDKYYVEKVYNLGDTVSEKKSAINIQAGGDIGNVSGIVGGDMSGVLNQGAIGGDINPDRAQHSNSEPVPKKPELIDLLQSLKTGVNTESALNDEDKAEALAQVEILTQISQTTLTAESAKTAKTALKILMGTVADLPSENPLFQTSQTLLPTIQSQLTL